jgi:hypothetical protein
MTYPIVFTAADADAETCLEEQRMELEALQAIYGPDFSGKD